MKYTRSIIFLSFVNLSFFFLDLSDLFVSCESTSELDEPVAGTSTAGDVEPVILTEEVDLSLYSSSGEIVSKKALEEELHELFRNAELSQIMAMQRSDPASKHDSDDEDELEGTSSGARSRKRMKYTCVYPSPGEGTSNIEGSLSPYYEMPQMFAEAFDTFLKDSFLDITLVEFEMLLFYSSTLYYSAIWRDRNKLNGKIVYLKVLLEYWGNQDFNINSSIKVDMSRYFQCMKTKYRSTIMKAYTGPLTTVPIMMEQFSNNIFELKCSNVKKSLAIIILLFENNFELLSSAFLFYLLLCSIKELKGLEFEQGFQLFKINKKKVVSKIMRLGGIYVKKFLKAMKRNIPEMSKLKVKEYKHPIESPLIMNNINIPTFGLKFCLSLLELYLINTSEFSMMNLIFFFGSRLNSAAEVFLSYDIFNTIRTIRGGIHDIISSILLDQDIEKFINRRIMALHHIDISDFRSRFGECIQIKNKYHELSSLIRLTDFQKEALIKKKLKRKRTRL
ncbi:uncharacterized protein cubi_03227 [Cryptosporidium ubiquitum]|uniref:Rhoptry protein n=1 Tax=Cryptosporidium ubiquitum TaxID=857276 RepID=A0A1J4M9N6_9CRYT|nr:uncharacterized protein cubi_03227 [Cryptosporidium ubiquitum]OII70929.1 hypothetical protein cubi_03227 [Cryptosporidium ubiquitum]